MPEFAGKLLATTIRGHLDYSLGRMPSFVEMLLGTPPRESAGGPSSNRHQFHRTWASCHLLKLHESGATYLLVMEYHDDVIVLDDDTDPQTDRFFQVKTKKTGSWTRTQLTTIEKKLREGSGPRSILGKLMHQGIRFGSHVVGLTIVSNAAFNVEMKAHPPSTDREEVLVTELDDEEAEALRAAVQAELQCGDDLPWDKVSFWATGISLTDHETYGIGQLAKFLERRNPGCLVAVAPLFRTLRDELGRRGDAEHQPANFSDLCRFVSLRTRACISGSFAGLPGRSRCRIAGDLALVAPRLHDPPFPQGGDGVASVNRRDDCQFELRHSVEVCRVFFAFDSRSRG